MSFKKFTPAQVMVRPAGLEPATYGSANRRSIQLSHGRINWVLSGVPLSRVTIALSVKQIRKHQWVYNPSIAEQNLRARMRTS
jgi:hypothetical protein